MIQRSDESQEMVESPRTGMGSSVSHRHLTLPTGVGLVVANMVGAGVLLSAGFMAQEMGPGAILLAWTFGILIALCGTKAYGAIAQASGRSGGEYRYLSDYVHPFVGCLAGAGSLVLGFAAPIAVDALAIGAYVSTLGLAVDGRLVGAATILLFGCAHAIGYTSSDRIQNLVVSTKILLLLVFVAVGFALGTHAWPTWKPPEATNGFPFDAFFISQYWIAFAMTGWNAAVYAAGEFHHPRRDVPRAMLIGCLSVAVLYLAINWVFVANLAPENTTVVFGYEETRITLGHTIMEKLLGPAGGAAMSVLVIFAFLGAISAMTLVGPRVYSAMAEDGFLPRAFAAREGRPPATAILLQTALALILVFTYDILEAVVSVGALLMASSGMTCLAVFVIHAREDLPPVSRAARVAAAVYALAMAWCLYAGRTVFGEKLAWAALLIVALATAFLIAERRRVSLQAS